MPFVQRQVYEGGFARKQALGDVPLPFFTVGNTNANDSAQTITAAQCLGGLYIRSGITAGRTDTTATAALIIAALAAIDNCPIGIGDSWDLEISNQEAFALTIAGGVGVTLTGRTTVPASGYGRFRFTKTSATALALYGI